VRNACFRQATPEWDPTKRRSQPESAWWPSAPESPQSTVMRARPGRGVSGHRRLRAQQHPRQNGAPPHWGGSRHSLAPVVHVMVERSRPWPIADDMPVYWPVAGPCELLIRSRRPGRPFGPAKFAQPREARRDSAGSCLDWDGVVSAPCEHRSVTFLADLITDTATSSTSLSELLRRVRVLASRAGVPEVGLGPSMRQRATTTLRPSRHTVDPCLRRSS
jgi:hypothetical protein